MRDAPKKRRPTPEQAFGRVLREVRESRDLSQEALGFESGYHRTYIGLLERGSKSPSLRTIFRLSRALKVSPSDLIGRTEKLVF
jgi:transcriptional regulator with XRE-family HTH domain